MWSKALLKVSHLENFAIDLIVLKSEYDLINYPYRNLKACHDHEGDDLP